jgi:hypothetical protein
MNQYHLFECQLISCFFGSNFFYVELRVHVELNKLKTIATWIPLIHQFKNLHNSHVIYGCLWWVLQIELGGC